MLSLVSRFLVSVGLILGLGPGCGGRPTTTQEPSPAADTTAAAAPAATLTADDIRDRPGEPIEVMLAARFPGVELRRAPDGELQIRIRGTTSLLGSNAPLYVLDGMPLEPQPGGSLHGINPYDIESIEVLRDPAETAIYGLRGANGVIIIKTKQR